MLVIKPLEPSAIKTNYELISNYVEIISNDIKWSGDSSVGRASDCKARHNMSGTYSSLSVHIAINYTP